MHHAHVLELIHVHLKVPVVGLVNLQLQELENQKLFSCQLDWIEFVESVVSI